MGGPEHRRGDTVEIQDYRQVMIGFEPIWSRNSAQSPHLLELQSNCVRSSPVSFVGFNRLRRGERSCDSRARSVPAGRQRRNSGGPGEFLTAVTGRLSEMHQPV